MDPKGTERSHEAVIQAPQPEAEQQARVPGPYEDQRRPRNPQPASPEGPETPHRENRIEVTRGRGGAPRPLPAGRPYGTRGKTVPFVQSDPAQRRDSLAIQTGEAEEDDPSGRLPCCFPRFASTSGGRRAEART